MRWLLLLYVFALTNAHPVQEEHYKQERDAIAELHGHLNLITYVENFKQIMAEYVKKSYHYLTTDDMELIKLILENFIKNFSNDLREILNGNKVDMDLNKKLEDDIPDDNFDVIKQNVEQEFKTNEHTTNQIVYTLRKGLLKTRKLLDLVIERSKNALEANSH